MNAWLIIGVAMVAFGLAVRLLRNKNNLPTQDDENNKDED